MNQQIAARPPKEEIQEVMHVHTVARHLKCHRSMVYKLIQEGHLRAIRLGKRGVRVVKASLIRYQATRKIDPAEYLE